MSSAKTRIVAHPDSMSESELARYWRVNQEWLRRTRIEGNGPPFFLANHPRNPKSTVIRYPVDAAEDWKSRNQHVIDAIDPQGTKRRTTEQQNAALARGGVPMVRRAVLRYLRDIDEDFDENGPTATELTVYCSSLVGVPMDQIARFFRKDVSWAVNMYKSLCEGKWGGGSRKRMDTSGYAKEVPFITIQARDVLVIAREMATEGEAK